MFNHTFQFTAVKMSQTFKGHMTRGEAFLIGHPDTSLGNMGKLPVARKILQYIKHLQELPGMSSKPVKVLVCCPLVTDTTTASCAGPAGCSSLGSDNCVVAALADY